MDVMHEQRLRDELADRARLLVEEFDQQAAGAVLRCFFRSVHLVRVAGVPRRDLVDAAEQRTRRALAGRGAVPVQRRR